MERKVKEIEESATRRTLGAHLTSSEIFLKYIFPEIKDKLNDFLWVDLYAGEGNLILPILNSISPENRVQFFEDHIFLYDIQPEMVKKCIYNAECYNVPKEIAKKKIKQRDNLLSFPKDLDKLKMPIFHITNPPYLYLGYIRKHKETQNYLKYFENENEGYQDLYQIAMMNDLRTNIQNLIYIIPSNFLFGASVSNKFRLNFLKYYKILKIIIFETKIFEFTGTNICIGFFKKKIVPKVETIEFTGLKIKKQNKVLKKTYQLKPNYYYRAGSEIEDFFKKYHSQSPLEVKYYLLKEDVLKNRGTYEVRVIDANNYKNNEYKKLTLHVNQKLKQEINTNILYIKTVDSGAYDGRVGLGIIKQDFSVQGIYVSSNTYRTHPIQIFLHPQLSIEDQHILKDYFNFILESFREKLDSEFLTTYKYSNAEYTRKYLGLTQVRKLIETFPIFDLNLEDKNELKLLIERRDFDRVLKKLKKF
ncbi:MAG: N-6 DNA methylase [Promethearchaeota archaeon]